MATQKLDFKRCHKKTGPDIFIRPGCHQLSWMDKTYRLLARLEAFKGLTLPPSFLTSSTLA